MSLQTRLTAAFQAVGADIKALFSNQGNLANLTSTDKTSLVAAINEARAASASGGVVLDDNAASSSTTVAWSPAKITAQIGSAVSGLLGGASSAFDTLQEIEARLGTDQTALDGLLTAVGNRVAFDAVQSLSAPQQLQAQQNIGLGNADADLVAVYNAAKA